MTDNNPPPHRRTALHDLVKSAEVYRSPNRILQTKYAESFSHFMEHQTQFHTPLKNTAAAGDNNLNKENLGASPMQWNSPTMTPPPSFVTANRTPLKNHPRNPFDANMTENLHLETFSPSVFSRVLSPSEDQDSNWRIEHVALLNPTDFSPNFHSHPMPADPSTEAEAQEKILQFFNQNKQIAPSPWSHPRSRILTRSKNKAAGDSGSPAVASSSKSAWTQTSLSFPPILPAEVEEVLRQYMNDPQDQTGHSPASFSNPNSEGDDSSLNASSLRRKLFTQISTTPSTSEDSARHYQTSREHSSSPILTTGPHSSRFSFSPCSRGALSPPVLSPICSHLDGYQDKDDEEEEENEEGSEAMDEATRQSWMGGTTSVGLESQPLPDRTVLMETYEAGYFSCSSNAAIQHQSSREVIVLLEEDDASNNAEASNLFTADKVGRPKECSTPTKTHF